MSNGLNGLIPSLFESLDVVSREQVGYIPAVALDADAAGAAVGQLISVPITPTSVAQDVTPSMSLPTQADQVIGKTDIVITKSREVPFSWNGEEQRGLSRGAGYNNIRRDQMTQAIRTLCNEVERDIGVAAYLGASRAVGVAGTTPFGSDLSATAGLLKVLKDNGSPDADLQCVIDTTAGAKMRTLTQLTKANEANDDSLLRQGVLLDVHGFAMRESAGVQIVTAGSGTLYKVSGAQTVGTTAIPLVTGTGTVNAGDVVTFAGDPNMYVVAAGVAGPGTITLAYPGLRAPLADQAAVTVLASHTANAAFQRNAIVLVARPPAAPEEKDLRIDSTIITDPRSGLSFEVSMWPGNRMVEYKIALAWGVKVIKPAHVATLLG